MPKKKSKDWIDRLSSEAKAEILASVLHQIEETPKIWKSLPKRIQRMIMHCQGDCGIWHQDLTKKDVKLVQEWFTPYKEK